MTKRIGTQDPAAAEKPAEYFEAFGRCAWIGGNCVTFCAAWILGAAAGIGRVFLHALVRVGGVLFGVLLALGCIVGLGYIVFLWTGRKS